VRASRQAGPSVLRKSKWQKQSFSHVCLIAVLLCFQMATFIGNKFGEEDHAKLVRCSARQPPGGRLSQAGRSDRA